MSTIIEQWVSGKGFPDELVIDGHIHIGDGERDHVTTWENAPDAIEGAIRYMDACGVDACCALTGGYCMGRQDYHMGNDFLLQIWDGLKGRFIPFVHINACDTKENILAEL